MTDRSPPRCYSLWYQPSVQLPYQTSSSAIVIINTLKDISLIMALANSSIQAYFSYKSSPGDGFSISERELSGNSSRAPLAANESLQRPTPIEQLAEWKPKFEYVFVSIADLHTGPGPVTFVGRAVNISDRRYERRRKVAQEAAQGAIKLVLSDGTGIVDVSCMGSVVYAETVAQTWPEGMVKYSSRDDTVLPERNKTDC
jgi:hypothetical protein